MDQNGNLLRWILVREEKVSDGDLGWEIIPVVPEKYEFEYRDKSKLMNIFDFSDYRDYNGLIKKVGFSEKLSCKNVKFSIETLFV